MVPVVKNDWMEFDARRSLPRYKGPFHAIIFSRVFKLPSRALFQLPSACKLDSHFFLASSLHKMLLAIVTAALCLVGYAQAHEEHVQVQVPADADWATRHMAGAAHQ